MFSSAPIIVQINCTGLEKLLRRTPPLVVPVRGSNMLSALAIAVRRDVQDVLEVHAVIDEVLSDVGEPLDLLGGLVAGAGDEALRLADDLGQVRQRGVEVGPAVVEHAGQRREPVLELHDLVVAVAQRGDEGLQVLDGVDDVAAAVGENPARRRTAESASGAACRRCRRARWRCCR